jgi:predicted SPOUT superfamily RNA methylase MTH1
VRSCYVWPSPYRSKPLIVVLPGSVLSTEHTLLLKTLKSGTIARALSVFRVSEVIIYRDPDTEKGDQRILSKVLKYLEVPPHLRKKLVPLQRELRWAGALPPLRTPHHDVPEEPRKGQVIEGLVIDKDKVYLGEKLGVWKLTYNVERAKKGSRILARIVDVKARVAEFIESSTFYSGYKVVVEDDLSKILKNLKKKDIYIIATSRKGRCVDIRVMEEISRNLRKRNGLALVFGGPRLGLLDFFKEVEMFDLVVNFIPKQGTKTVRTEEALWTSLAIINLIATL